MELIVLRNYKMFVTSYDETEISHRIKHLQHDMRETDKLLDKIILEAEHDIVRYESMCKSFAHFFFHGQKRIR